MTIHITWYDDNRTIVLYTLYRDWTLDDVIRATKEFDANLDGQPLYYMLDMREAGLLPDGLLAERNVLFRHFNTPGVLVVTVGANRLVQWLADMLRRMGITIDIRFADSCEQAETLIQQHKERKQLT